ncbi:hypothetical protein BGZ61DRAFT_498309 [Ilyonectria robusta]|uniref:uncharacterized protein n=1 Tax=Ilyonectria robusta TaxID=1079257 RepID=UPI001E8CB4E0|nr:uncharacterized protein BGZ61DRAFT_498309 [Ilyonectria robusta]KAH8667827.1 hypothetical protein BGZ61DRAFT_498309 [Ilyonectria robusta]
MADQVFLQWGIGWKFPVLIICLFMTGVGTALGHHFYYQSLADTEVQSQNQQSWAIRIGTGLAVLNKTVLAAILGMIATQQTWVTLRRRSISLHGIDSMFKIMSDPIAMFDYNLWTGAKTLLLLAIISWCLPLVKVITPATLSIRSLMRSQIIPTAVPTVDFSNGTEWATFAGAGRVTGASFELARLFAAIFSSVSFIPLTAPFVNSTYDLNFWGPSYKCLSLEEVVTEQNTPTWDTENTLNNYTSFQKAWDELIVAPGIGASGYDGSIYTAVAPYFMNNMILIWSSGVNDESHNSSQGTSIVCQLYNTSYDISVRFHEGVQSIAPSSIQYLHPHAWDGSEGTWSYFSDSLGMGTAWVTHILFSYLLTARVKLGRALEDFQTGGEGTIPLLQSGLIDCPEFWNTTRMTQLALPNSGKCRNQSLARAIEDLSHNFTYSMMTFYDRRRFTTTVPVNVSSPRNFYSYDVANLMIVYGASLATVLFWTGVGAVALWSNGVTSSSSFSTMLLTTRNPDLDKLAEGYSLGADPLPKEIGELRLKFGCLDGEESKHAGFGLDGTVCPVTKGEILR